MSDQAGTGIRAIMRNWHELGRRTPEITNDKAGKSFQLVLCQEPLVVQPVRIATELTGQVTGQVESWVLRVLAACLEPKKSSEIQEITAIKHRETFQHNYLDFMLDEGLLALTIPEKPRSRLQRYQTTDQGKALLETDKK